MYKYDRAIKRSEKQAVKLYFISKLWIDNTSKIHPKYAPDRLFWTLKMQKLPVVGGGYPLHTLPLHIFSGFLIDRRVMCLMYPLEWQAGCENYIFFLNFG